MTGHFEQRIPMVGHFKQYIPAFCSVIERIEFDFKTLEELLEKQLKPVGIKLFNLKYYYEQYTDSTQLLIQGFNMVLPVSDTVNKTKFQWIVLGYVTDFDLSKHLPLMEYPEERRGLITEPITVHNPGDGDDITISKSYTIEFHL